MCEVRGYDLFTVLRMNLRQVRALRKEGKRSAPIRTVGSIEQALELGRAWNQFLIREYGAKA